MANFINHYKKSMYGDFLAQFDSNVFGTIKVTRALLPHLRQRRTGTLILVGSLSGWHGHAGFGAYSGSKFALEGLVESLGRETAHLGIKPLLIEPGRFRTKVLSSSNMKAVASGIADYTDMSKELIDILGIDNQAQDGDLLKLVEIVLDLVRQEGVAKGREIPFRFPLGNDVYHDIKAKCETTLKLLKDWESIIRSTDYGS